MIKQTNLSTLSLAVLGLISGQPMSGYDVRKVFATTPMGRFSSSPGAIYPALARLEREGLIRGEVENVGTLRPRKVYSLTDQGRRAIKEALQQSVTQDDIIWRQDDVMLRFVFMEGVLGREDTIRFLGELAFHSEAYVASLEEQLTTLRPDMPLHTRFALEHGIGGYRMDAEWARRVISELKGGRR